jgi:sigma-B regulation protein RsbU (phosphoserine phosphatase)
LLTGEGYEPGTVSSLAAACLGALQKLILVKTQLSCPSGDGLLRFTYGLTEAADESNEQFGEERLMELLSRYRDSSAENLKQVIFKAVGNSAVTPSKTTRPR